MDINDFVLPCDPGCPLRIHSCVPDCVFLAFGGNYSIDIASGSTIRKIPIVYHDSSHIIHLRLGYCT